MIMKACDEEYRSPVQPDGQRKRSFLRPALCSLLSGLWTRNEPFRASGKKPDACLNRTRSVPSRSRFFRTKGMFQVKAVGRVPSSNSWTCVRAASCAATISNTSHGETMTIPWVLSPTWPSRHAKAMTGAGMSTPRDTKGPIRAQVRPAPKKRKSGRSSAGLGAAENSYFNHSFTSSRNRSCDVFSESGSALVLW